MNTRRLNWIVLLACSLVLVAGGAFGVVAVLVTIGVPGLFAAPAIPTIALFVLGVGGVVAAAWLRQRPR